MTAANWTNGGRRPSDINVLVVEDDEADAVYLAACLEESGYLTGAVRWATTLAEGRRMLKQQADCVLVDLGLPDATGLQAVEAMVDAAPRAAVIVLTGLDDPRVERALAVGAQDYLVKAQLSPEILGRSIRYAVERKSAELTARELQEARLQDAENRRLARGLLPTPLVSDARLDFATYYRPAEGHVLLGGDFFDVVEGNDKTLRVIIGDVMGHGPDQAALGVQLRAAWRALVLAGLPQATVLETLNRMVEIEAPSGSFVTACDVVINAQRDAMQIVSCGHPPPVLAAGEQVAFLSIAPYPPLGLGTFAEVKPAICNLPGRWQLLFYTDGLLDSFRDLSEAGDIGLEGLAESAAASHEASIGIGGDLQQWVQRLLTIPERPPTDDIAVLSLDFR